MAKASRPACGLLPSPDFIECVLDKRTPWRHRPAMTLHPVLAEKLIAAAADVASRPLTRRDARLPAVPGKVHAVVGMRRAGKTTFLHQLLEERREAGPPECALYLSFDDDRLAGIEADQLALLLEEHYRRQPELRGRRTVHWLLDEIQLVPGWDRFLRRVLDTEKVELVVSGSSARMLSREVHTSLRGRGMETVIGPFNFREFLRHRGEEPARNPQRWTAAERSLVEKRFLEFLAEGGFPEAQGLPAALRIELLQGYVDAVLFRDVVERYGISQVAALRWLVRQCLRNPAGSFSVHRLHQDLRAQGHGVAKDAVHAMLGHLLDAFLLGAVPLATESERQRNSNPRKLYTVDPGLIRAFDASGRSNVGHALETAVHNELARRKAETGYLKTSDGLEVDFLARAPAGGEELLQVCADPSSPEVLGRELRALETAGVEYPRARRLVLVLDRSQALRVRAADVEVQPAYEWLLETAGEP
ncbi:MAG: ATP-binding protein [Burkholderiales bacterium]|nr:ATP-binding protein [Burkholderiales bacterium]